MPDCRNRAAKVSRKPLPNTDRAVVSAVAEMYATGTSTRKVQRIAEKLGISRLSKDQVSAIAKDLDADCFSQEKFLGIHGLSLSGLTA